MLCMVKLDGLSLEFTSFQSNHNNLVRNGLVENEWDYVYSVAKDYKGVAKFIQQCFFMQSAKGKG